METQRNTHATRPDSNVLWAQTTLDRARGNTSVSVAEMVAFSLELDTNQAQISDTAMEDLFATSESLSGGAAAHWASLDTDTPKGICLTNALRTALAFCAYGLTDEETANAVATFAHSPAHLDAPTDPDVRAFDVFDWSALPDWMSATDMAVLLASAEEHSCGEAVGNAVLLAADIEFSTLNLMPYLERHLA